jgi:predicted aspartyl protease
LVTGKFKAYIFVIVLCLCFVVNGCKVPPKFEKILAGGSLSTDGITESIVHSQFKNNMIFIKARINDSEQEYNFLIDTGAFITVINQKIADSMGLKKEAEDTVTDEVGNYRNVDVVVLKSLKIGEIAVQNCGALVADFGNIESFGVRFDGVIGTNFLRFFLVDIDYEKEILTFSTEQSFLNKLSAGEGLAFTYVNHDFRTKLRLADGNSVDALIDTGNIGDLLTVPVKNLAQWKPYLNCPLVKSQGIITMSAFGGSNAMLSRINEIWIAGNRIINLPVAFVNSDHINISNGFLAHFKVIINYPKKLLFLIRNERKPFATNISSFGYVPQYDANGKLLIVGIWEGSPAEKNGLKVGDQIIRQTYEEPDTVHLVIKNENGKSEKEIMLKSAVLLPEI